MFKNKNKSQQEHTINMLFLNITVLQNNVRITQRKDTCLVMLP